MKNHPVIILIVVIVVIGAILYFIASGKSNTSLTGTAPTGTTPSGGVVFPLLRSANDATVSPVAVRYLGTARPSIL